jgi:hypothetical protein
VPGARSVSFVIRTPRCIRFLGPSSSNGESGKVVGCCCCGACSTPRSIALCCLINYLTRGINQLRQAPGFYCSKDVVSSSWLPPASLSSEFRALLPMMDFTLLLTKKARKRRKKTERQSMKMLRLCSCASCKLTLLSYLVKMSHKNSAGGERREAAKTKTKGRTRCCQGKGRRVCSAAYPRRRLQQREGR